MNIYDFSATDITGKDVDFASFKGKTLLIVNTASKCGFTPQYKELQELFDTYKDKGLLVLGFPCNQFGQQEKGTEEEISQFCKLNYDVDFPLFKKIKVNGKEAHPLYKYLKKQAPGILGSELIKWNFTKFLVDKEGKKIKRFASKFRPQELSTYIEEII